MLPAPANHPALASQPTRRGLIMALSLEIVVVGTGDRTERLQPQVMEAMRQRGIAVEVQDTVSPATWEC